MEDRNKEVVQGYEEERGREEGEEVPGRKEEGGWREKRGEIGGEIG